MLHETDVSLHILPSTLGGKMALRPTRIDAPPTSSGPASKTARFFDSM